MKGLSKRVYAGMFVVILLLLASCQTSAGKKPNAGAETSVPTTGLSQQATGAPLSTSQGTMPPLPITGDKAQPIQTEAAPQIIIYDQNVSTGKVIVDRVISQGPGWLVIHSQNADGTPGDVMGYAPVKDGVNDHMTVTISRGKPTPVLIAILYTDAGIVGQFEYPGADQPVVRDGQLVLSVFSVSALSKAVPANTVAPTVEAPQQADTQTPTMGGMANMSQPAGTPAAPAPAQAATPLVQIADQPVKNGAIQVNRVVSDGPGWVVIYTMKSGQPDTAIGRAPVHAGENQNISVPIDASNATGTLDGILHIDAGQVGTFEYPGPDAPVVVGLRFASTLFNVSTQQAAKPGASGQANNAPPANSARPLPYVNVVDQPIHESTVIIPEIFSDGISWMVIHPVNPDGTVGSYIGYALLQDGLNRNVRVQVNTRFTTQKLMAMLHVDASHASIPQYPGVDMPIMINGQMIAPTFNVLGSRVGDVLLIAFTAADGQVHLADSFGMTLYTDVTNQPQTCNPNAGCLFRPLRSSGVFHAGAGVSVGKMKSTPLPDGTKQITYDGAPLYYCITDQNPGDTNGQGLDGRWNVITP